ncbi:Gfo/Idh/MocA family protein [Pelagibacterium luteolum]|uniref:D-galactose 1-dehydrogenase n=1 Tax=Pelagibacterium luteolum TaxID=440168 RepID=A0A1G7XSK6_9HYPH|nr:Gfo/Idh/MocA family oxidoreductase [Pelagibacterium luteolum]SDG86700.1 D-galactose 1-dehydrogenase [Pelagibacterium luteolum]
MAHKIAILGLGKIARDQHLPSIEKNPDFELAAIVSRNADLDGVEHFTALNDMLAARPDIGTIALCTPPQVRFELAVAALKAGRHVLLEKPPGATVAEVEALKALAREQGVTLFATWHSRYAQGVEPARTFLADKTVKSAEIIWREDVRRWHPGQDWIWQPGGMGVFDPGINALSILTHILPAPVHVVGASLEVPRNRQTPIGAKIAFKSATGHPVSADFDWRQEGPQTWDITVKTDAGTVTLSSGGAVLAIDGATQLSADDTEYDGIYAHFAALLAAGESDVDISPLQLVADAYMLGEIRHVDDFIE